MSHNPNNKPTPIEALIVRIYQRSPALGWTRVSQKLSGAFMYAYEIGNVEDGDLLLEAFMLALWHSTELYEP